MKTKNPKQTPMMKQYFEIKNRHPDKYLFFRLGDFYEMFDQDAIEVSSMLQITLTERNQIPMCGIPHHQLHRYAHKVIAQGKKVVIVEQDDKPAELGLVKRRIAQIITPGTTTDEMNLIAEKKNFIISFYFPQDEKLLTETEATGMVALETTTGEVVMETLGEGEELSQVLGRFFENYRPAEMVLPESYRQHASVLMLAKEHPHLIINHLPDPTTHQVNKKMMALYPQTNKDFISSQCYNGYRALYLLVLYTEENYGDFITYLQPPREFNQQQFMSLDQQTMIHLELFKNNYDHRREHSLLSVIDYTRTPMGARKLQENLALPYLNRTTIEERLNRVEYLYQNPLYFKELRGCLSHVVDLERVGARLALKRIFPRDFLSLKRSLVLIRKLFTAVVSQTPHWLEKIYQVNTPQLHSTKNHQTILNTLTEIIDDITTTLLEEPENDLSKGNYINPAVDTKLNDYCRIKNQGEELLAKLEFREKQDSGIPNLRVKYNDNLGYFFETGKNKNVPPHFVRKQSLVNCERYVSEELLKLDSEIQEAREKSNDLERELYEQLRVRIAGHIAFFQDIAGFVAGVDIETGFAELATVQNWCKPTITESGVLDIREGRHPVVESGLEDPFIPNDLIIGVDQDIIQIITGPNMSGKSTFLRQNALMVILAHLGCFLPATAATVPLCDQVFTRVGSGDRLFQGESTFLVEMKETARILNHVTPRGLVVMDEIGRGTSTYDGLALAWSILEYLNRHPEKRAKTLFATHYHELISLTSEKGITHYHVSIREDGDQIIFLKKVVQGVTSRSYGIQVAQLAGMPEEVIVQARTLLQDLEKKQETITPGAVTQDLPSSQPSWGISTKVRAWQKKILEFDVTSHTPLEAINFLSELQREVKESQSTS